MFCALVNRNLEEVSESGIIDIETNISYRLLY